MVPSGRAVPLLVAAALLVLPGRAFAQSYGSETLPGGVEAKPEMEEMNRSLKSPAPAAKRPAEDVPEAVSAPAPDDTNATASPDASTSDPEGRASGNKE